MIFQLVKDSNRTATGAVNTAPNGTPTKPRDVRKALSFELPSLLLSYSKPQKMDLLLIQIRRGK